MVAHLAGAVRRRGAGWRVKVADSVAWREALAQVPGSDAAAAVEVQALAGGTTNATYRVRTRMGSFVVRLHEAYTLDLGVDRQREAVLHELAGGAGLASRVLAADPEGRYLVTEFLDGSPWRLADMADAGCLQDLAHTLAEVHALPVPCVKRQDLQGLLERHVTQLASLDAAAAGELARQVARAQDILARQADAGRKACVVHGDLAHTNMIGQGRPRLIDWEYAAVGDPLLDLACLVAYYPQVQPHGAMLLRRCGLPESANLSALEDLAWVYRLLSDIWYRRLTLARRHPSPAH